MLSRLKLAAVFLLCAFSVAYSAPPVVQPSPLVLSQGTRPVSWSELSRRLDERAFYEAATRTTQPAEKKRVEYVPSGDMASLICSVFVNNCARAVQVAKCESGLNPSAYNRSGASGLFQLLGHGSMFVAHGWSAGDVFDPYKNTVVAFDLSRGGTNWSPWVCR